MIERLRIALLISILGFVAFAANAADLAQTTSNVRVEHLGSALSLNFDLGNLAKEQVVKNGVSCDQYSIPMEGTTYDYGRPMLPAVSRFVVVPPDAGLELEVTADTPRELRAVAPPALCDDSLLTYKNLPAIQGTYPGKLAEMSEPFVIRGARLVKITIYPIQYDPAANSYQQYSNIQTSIRFTNGEVVNPVTAPSRKWRSRNFMKALEAMAVNPEDLTRDDPVDTEPPYIGHYLVAAHNATIPWIRDYIEFRRKTGYKMDIYSVTNNDAGSPDAVKRGIQSRYDDYLHAGVDPFDELMIVGDEPFDRPANNGPQNQIPSFAGQSVWGANGYSHADFLFGCLEGGANDNHPDVGYSRMPAGSQGASALIFGRTMAYEATPSMQDTGWFRRGGVYSAHWGNGADEAWHISIHTNVRWGEEVLKSLGFNNIWFYENTQYDQLAQQLVGPITDAYNSNRNVMIGRAELYCWRDQLSGLHNDTFPIDICYSGHGEWCLQCLFRTTGDGNHPLQGPVARTCCWGWPATMPINYNWLSMVNSLMQRDMPLGWARNLSVNSIENYFPDFSVYNNVNLYIHIKTDTDCFGDPGIQPWIGVPRLAEVTVPQAIPASTRMLEVFVHAPNSQDAIPGAQVTFYAPGSMPQDAAQYAAYTSFLMKTTKSDSSGMARFLLDDNQQLVNNTPLYVSVSGRDIRPFTAQINIAAQPSSLALGDWTLNEQAGNGDDAVNPGETFSLTLAARNTGNQEALQGISATVESLSPYLEVVDGGEVFFGDLDAGAEAQSDAPITIHFSPATPDGASRPITQPVLAVDFASGDSHWRTAIKFNPVAPNLELLSIVGGNVVADTMTDLNLDISNLGRLGSQDLNVELRSQGMGVTVVDGSSTLHPLATGQHARIDRPFSVSGNSVVVPGSKTPMVAIFSNGDGVTDSAFFQLQVMSERANAPTGPDKYGYICFDDGDTDWDAAPHYRWFEINQEVQDYDFEGSRLQALEGNTDNDIGKCLAVPLGFTTQFYGHDYDTITIATNGFISLGNQPRITNYCNWPMDKAMGGGVGMIAPYWDDLRFGQNGRILAYHDEDSSRFIVEWYRMIPATGNAELTFEVVIYDKQFGPWITESGDPNVQVEYKTISALANIRQTDQEWVSNIAYGSVGISSPTGQTGINYYFNNHYAISAGALQNRRALVFSTSPKYRACTLFGRVTDAWTGIPMEGVTVKTQHGFAAITDANGEWRIQDALAEVHFYITAHKTGYNDSTYTDQQVAENAEQEIDFDLLHPEFTPSTDHLEARLDPGLQVEIPFQVYNGGNGPLTWSAQKRLLGDANAAPWELRRSYSATDSTHDNRIEGVVFANEQFYVCGANGTNPNMMYVLDRNGSLVNSYQQCGNSNLGFKDLEWDGSLIWGSGERTVYGFLPDDGQIIYSWDGPYATNTAIAWDSDNGLLWLASTVTNITACDVNGNTVDRTLARKGLNIYGLAYWPDDPDGYKLYIVDEPGHDEPTLIYKMNTETGDTIRVESLPFSQGSTGMNGTFITNQFDVYSWVLMAIDNVAPGSGGDQIKVYQMDARRDWFNLDTWNGVLNPDNSQDFVLTLNSTGLPDTVFQSELRFSHNADGLTNTIGVQLRVIGPMPPETFPLVSPTNEDTLTALPLHGDTLNVPALQFVWDPSHDPNHADTLITYLLNLQVNNQKATIATADTEAVVNLDSLRLPIWFDTPVTWWVDAISGRDTVESNQRFDFIVRMNDIDRGRFGQPVAFGLTSIYPSPFNSVTRIKFGADRAVRTTLKAYDVLGREAAVLFDQVPQVGYYQVAWDAGRLASGVYVLRLESAGRSQVQKVALIR